MSQNETFPRRDFLRTAATGLAAFSATHLVGGRALNMLSGPAGSTLSAAPLSKFKVGLITDEVSNDLEVAVKFLKSFNLQWVELRNLWDNKYITEAPPDYIARAKKLLDAQQMRVSVI